MEPNTNLLIAAHDFVDVLTRDFGGDAEKRNVACYKASLRLDAEAILVPEPPLGASLETSIPSKATINVAQFSYTDSMRETMYACYQDCCGREGDFSEYKISERFSIIVSIVDACLRVPEGQRSNTLRFHYVEWGALLSTLYRPLKELIQN